jgi:hypothetical protein
MHAYVSTGRAPRCGAAVWLFGGAAFLCLVLTLGVQAAAADRAPLDAGEAVVVFEDDFESGVIHGWDFFGPESTASTGVWVIGDPNGTVNPADGAQAQPEDAYRGVGCVFTEQNSSLGVHDVDLGVSFLVSPLIDLSGYRSAELGYARWFYSSAPGADFQDYFVSAARSSGTSDWVTLEMVDTDMPGTNNWTPCVFRLEDFITLTESVQLRFGARDGQLVASVVEGAVDEVIILGIAGCVDADDCASGEYCDDAGFCVRYGDGDFDADGDVDLADMAQFQACFLSAGQGLCAPGNLAGDASVDLTDYAALAEILDGPH